VSGVEHQRAPIGSHPYATGGGGTVLEHRFGATLLAHLLTGDPVSGLGDDCDPAEVVFQASSFSPVDDLVVRGCGPGGSARTLSIGVRRAPSLVPSNPATVHLLGAFLQVVTNEWDAVREGQWRLQLAASALNADVRQLHELATIAQASPNGARFREAVAQPQRASQLVRSRLVQLDRLVGDATAEDVAAEVSPAELTWRLLSVLSTRELRLEGVDMSDRTESIARLRSVTTDESVEAADSLFAALTELAGRYAPAGATVTEASLRRDLAGRLDLARSTRHASGRRLLDSLSERLRLRTGLRLGDGEAAIELERTDERAGLARALDAVSANGSMLLITGEPDVGKSALVMKVCDQIGDRASVTMLSLRDLPASSADAEARFGVALQELLSGEAVSARRLLVVDGTEAVLEGRRALLTDLAAAAMGAGLGVVAVTRSDAATAVTDALRQATHITPAGGDRQLSEYTVPRLTDAEIDEVVDRFGALVRFGREPRARWLLGRPGLTELLLRGDATQALPDGALSEADVFAAVWHAVVRNGNRMTDFGVSPDAREQALLALARTVLLGSGAAAVTDAGALSSLRSDGLLLPAGPTSAWNPSDEFAGDLIRDLCVARLLIVDGPELLVEAGGPRWAVRAARLACQGLIARASADSEQVRSSLQLTFDVLAEQHGERWAAVVLEASLTLGTAHDVISRAWPALASGDAHRAIGLIRFAMQRHAKAMIGDPIVLAPLVEIALDQGLVHASGGGWRDELAELIVELTLAWLRGRVLADNSSDPMRARVRDHLLAEENHGDEFVVEALALMGPDLNAATDERLRQLGEQGGGDLGPAVESFVAHRTMAQQCPDLLLALTDAYYVDRPQRRSRGGSGFSRLNEGVREHMGIGLAGPRASSMFGPFWSLLNVRPVDAIRLINGLLDHAASVRVAHQNELWPTSDEMPARRQGMTLELPGGARFCVGNEQVWMWYRGSANGPYPAMSALMAAERFADGLLLICAGVWCQAAVVAVGLDIGLGLVPLPRCD
jgi:hypothetical protein